MILNSEQQICVEAIEGNYAVIASPGSGKTSVLVQRHLNMLTKGVQSSDILNLTFTSAAADTMVRRVGLLDADRIFRTFHSFAIELLKKEKDQLSFKLNDSVIPVAMEDYKLLFDLVKRYPAIVNFRTLQEKISLWKRTNVEPEEAKDTSVGVEYFYALAYEDYETECREGGWLDFDSIIRETVHLLETNEDVKNRWKKKYISVDEFQDTDSVQTKLLTLISGGNVFAVGDENQLVYAWRGAQPKNLTDFSKTFPGAKTLFLGQNFRSTVRLVSFLKKILPEDNGLASHMFTENEEGVDPVIVKYGDDQEEAYWVLAQIDDPVNTAIIARTNRQLYLFQRICAIKNIKYKVLGKKDYFELNEVKKLLNLAKDDHSNRAASVVLSELIERHRLMDLYKHSITNDSNPVENLNDLVKISAGKGTVPEFTDYLRKRMHGRKSAKGLTLSTAHQSKGTEYNNVFIVGAEQGRMPHKDGELAEERRIFFVSASRAAKFLHISFSGHPSMFLDEFRGSIKNLSQEEL